MITPEARDKTPIHAHSNKSLKYTKLTKQLITLSVDASVLYGDCEHAYNFDQYSSTY